MAIVADKVLQDLLKAFPAKYSYAFAYGSAVFAQKNQQPGKMTDLVFVVDNALDWHTANLSMNSRHYSGIRMFGAKFITSLQEKMACGVYYNPYCKIDGRVVKYGVISTAAFEDDLKNWRHIYIAGRLHKPVVDLCPPSHPSLVDSIKRNRQSALRTALLQRGRFMSKFELFHNIAEISYLGDTRMRFAENPDKTKNIVTPLMREFDLIYSPLLNEIPSLAVTSDGSIAQDISPTARYKNLIALPIPIQISLVRSCFKDPRFVDVEQILADLSYLPNLNFFIRKAISEVVRNSSIRQTVQGFFSAGMLRSTVYALEKLRKGAFKKTDTAASAIPSSSVVPLVVTEAKDQLLIPPSATPPAKLIDSSSPPSSSSTKSENSQVSSNNNSDTLSSALSAVVPSASSDDSENRKKNSFTSLFQSSNSKDDDGNDSVKDKEGHTDLKIEDMTTIANANKSKGGASATKDKKGTSSR